MRLSVQQPLKSRGDMAKPSSRMLSCSLGHAGPACRRHGAHGEDRHGRQPVSHHHPVLQTHTTVSRCLEGDGILLTYVSACDLVPVTWTWTSASATSRGPRARPDWHHRSDSHSLSRRGLRSGSLSRGVTRRLLVLCVYVRVQTGGWEAGQTYLSENIESRLNDQLDIAKMQQRVRHVSIDSDTKMTCSSF